MCAFTRICLGLLLSAAMGGPAAHSHPLPAPAIRAFDMHQVRLEPGLFRVAQEATRRYLHELDPERLLYAFRVNAGLPAPGEPLGGWERPDCEVRGHFVGHYLSACGLMYASTGDEALRDRALYMVGELAKCQKALGGQYLSAYPESFFDRLESMADVPWAAYYTIHKIMAGLLDAYQYCHSEQALDVLLGMARYFGARTGRLPIYQMDRVLTVEFGGMSEVLHNLYAVTGDPEHLELAHRFDRAEFLGPLALGHDNLSRIHANTHIPEICGAARRYEVTGEPAYREIVTFFWDRVVNTRTYATGGCSSGEMWPDPGCLAGTLGPNTQECCTTHNMLKVTRYLYRWTGDPRYAEFTERALLNGILGTNRADTGQMIYYVPLSTGHTKAFGTPNDSFWCCYGTGIESFSKLNDSIYFHDDHGLYVAQFIASTLDWHARGLRVEQRTRFPEEESTELRFRTDRRQRFTLHVRVPRWARGGVSIAVNGGRIQASAEPGSYLSLEREWADGDRVRVRMPMALHVETLPDDPETGAILYGPVVLAGLTSRATYFVANPDDVAAWVHPVAGDAPLVFSADAPNGQADERLNLIPWYRVVDEPYGVYWTMTREGSPTHRRILDEERAERQRQARVVDTIAIGDEANEREHNLQGEATASGSHLGRAWRHAAPGGWWSWDLAVPADEPAVLCCDYWGSESGRRTFDILIDGTTLATQTLLNDAPGRFFSVEYPIPVEATRGKDRVTVRIVPHEGNIAGGLFGCAVLRAAKP